MADARAFQVDGGTVVVSNPDGRVVRQAVPEGVSATVFRHVLGAVDVWWNTNGTFPLPKEARTLWPKYSVKTFEAIFATDEFHEALEKRGVNSDPHAGLSEQQIAALTVLSNPGDRRSVTSKLQDVGVSYATFQNWMKGPLFSRLYKDRIETLLGDSVPTAIMAVVGNVEAGDQRAAEFVLKMTGRFDPSALEQNNARIVVLRLLELIQQFAPKEVQEQIERGLDGTLTQIKVTSALKEIG
jgi:hypothetical protein